jgi:hypothetical protein
VKAEQDTAYQCEYLWHTSVIGSTVCNHWNSWLSNNIRDRILVLFLHKATRLSSVSRHSNS